LAWLVITPEIRAGCGEIAPNVTRFVKLNDSKRQLKIFPLSGIDPLQQGEVGIFGWIATQVIELGIKRPDVIGYPSCRC
jgi:hypothetical protein